MTQNVRLDPAIASGEEGVDSAMRSKEVGEYEETGGADLEGTLSGMNLLSFMDGWHLRAIERVAEVVFGWVHNIRCRPTGVLEENGTI